MDHSLNSLNNSVSWRVVLQNARRRSPVDILPLLVTWMKNIEPGFAARYAWYCQQMMQTRELELEH